MELIIWVSREGTHTRQPHDNYRRYELRDGKMRLHDYRHSLRATDLLAFVHHNGSNVDSSFIFLWWIVGLARTFPLVHKTWKCHPPPTPHLGLIIEFEELQTSPLFGLSTANSDFITAFNFTRSHCGACWSCVVAGWLERCWVSLKTCF